MKWVFLGLPGAGKGTQSKKIAEFRGVPHISTGDLLRTEVSSNTELGQKAKEYMEGGSLVPDALVIEMVAHRIESLSGYILDGFPRTLAQAEALDSRTNGQGVDRVINLELDEDHIIARLGARRTCRECGAMYHLEFVPPAKPDMCDKCGGPLFQREDDKPDTIRRRAKIAREQAGPLLEFYTAKGLVAPIDASRAPEVIQEELRGLLRDV